MSATENKNNCVAPVCLTSDTTYQSPRLDATTHSRNVIDYAHHEVHDGSSFGVCYDADKTIGQAVEILLVTPDTTKWAHMTYSVENESEMAFALYEGTTTSNNGTSITAYNRDRNSATAATTLAYHTPTITGDGTAIFAWHSGSGRGTPGTGGDRGIIERILKQNTKYLFRMTATAAGWIAIKIDWYEHTNKVA
jgi:hypothetical protein